MYSTTGIFARLLLFLQLAQTLQAFQSRSKSTHSLSCTGFHGQGSVLNNGLHQTASRAPQSSLFMIDPTAQVFAEDVLKSVQNAQVNEVTSSTLSYMERLTITSSSSSSSLLSLGASSFLTNTDVWVFVAGIIPFVWATIEFWRRIAVGEPFGTGSDSVIIGEGNNPESSHGKRVLGKDALIVAYLLFGISAAVVGFVLYTVLTNDAPPPDFASSVVSEISDM